jgi:hypothetical protein
MANVPVADGPFESADSRLGSVLMREGYHEHMIVERNDGRLWLLARTDALPGASIPPIGKEGIAESFSSAGGRTWTRGEASKIPNVNARFFMRG